MMQFLFSIRLVYIVYVVEHSKETFLTGSFLATKKAPEILLEYKRGRKRKEGKSNCFLFYFYFYLFFNF
jgi:hypothetical protein